MILLLERDLGLTLALLHFARAKELGLEIDLLVVLLPIMCPWPLHLSSLGASPCSFLAVASHGRKRLPVVDGVELVEMTVEGVEISGWAGGRTRNASGDRRRRRRRGTKTSWWLLVVHLLLDQVLADSSYMHVSVQCALRLHLGGINRLDCSEALVWCNAAALQAERKAAQCRARRSKSALRL